MLISEAEAIPINSFDYSNLEFYPPDTVSPAQRIIFGFSLPRSYFSRTPSADTVVNVFCNMVTYINNQRAWNMYLDRDSTDDRDILVKVSIYLAERLQFY